MSQNFKISELTLCATNINEMIVFYQNVFNIEFKELSAYGTQLYSGKFLGLNILICPNEIAQVNAQQNRHQFEFVIDDIEEIVKVSLESHGKLKGEISTLENEKIVTILDPDDNTIIFIEKL